ncbi:hypothetical protein C0Q70_19898 [Pomacea canaliculata]|uniref:Uncharacterized protein n=1 Tax=Pomacea canaliculata TaxID=400727 RepID=A0A2T7NE17_POMCA|nr:hypothetical protein C0Q70_19898 [Pomacea canaliculata]
MYVSLGTRKIYQAIRSDFRVRNDENFLRGFWQSGESFLADPATNGDGARAASAPSQRSHCRTFTSTTLKKRTRWLEAQRPNRGTTPRATDLHLDNQRFPWDGCLCRLESAVLINDTGAPPTPPPPHSYYRRPTDTTMALLLLQGPTYFKIVSPLLKTSLASL